MYRSILKNVIKEDKIIEDPPPPDKSVERSVAERISFLRTVVSQTSDHKIKTLYQQIIADIDSGKIYPIDGKVWVYNVDGQLTVGPVTNQEAHILLAEKITAGECLHIESCLYEYATLNGHIILPRDADGFSHHHMHLQKGNRYVTLKFMYDTGASTIMIYEQDLLHLALPLNHVEGYIPTYAAGDTFNVKPFVWLHVSNSASSGYALNPGQVFNVACTIASGSCNPHLGAHRLKSSVTKANMYTASKPMGTTSFTNVRSRINTYHADSTL